ncbi:MAG: hypothetical protein ACK5V1_09875 [Planctomycetaceae bacterium]
MRSSLLPLAAGLEPDRRRWLDRKSVPLGGHGTPGNSQVVA